MRLSRVLKSLHRPASDHKCHRCPFLKDLDLGFDGFVIVVAKPGTARHALFRGFEPSDFSINFFLCSF